jgi:hypothetical protein
MHIFKQKGGFIMGILWITTIGFVLCIGFVGATIFHFINEGLNKEDSTRIDKINKDTED